MKKFWPYVLLILLIFFVAVANYIPGTWLSGWDNLHPEFNFALNIKRSIFSVWQEYQGLGLLGGMAHAADLVRQIFLLIVSLIMPTSFLRYFYHFLMLFLGTVGIYSLVKFILKLPDPTTSEECSAHRPRCLDRFSDSLTDRAAFLGALFYLFNLGTIQYFFVPFEPYSSFWGFFPWLIFSLFKYLNNPTKKNLFLLFLINFFATPSYYVQTLFLVYVLCVSVILLVNLFKTKIIDSVKRSFIILLIIGLVNSFWLLPNLYFIKNNLSVAQNAMQNRMATEKFFQMNKKHGTIFDFAILREFYYDFFEYDKDINDFTYLLKDWRDHFSSIGVQFIGYSFFAIVLFGLTRKNRYRTYNLTLFFLCALFFLSATPVVDILNDYLRVIPIVNQIFRNPFTKFIVPTVLIFSIGFALGMVEIFKLLDKYLDREKGNEIIIGKNILKTKVIGQNLLFFSIMGVLFLYAFPIFEGKLFAKQVRVTIPNDYFQLFAYFERQDKSKRIMNLPQGSFWGWNYYRFGAVGSGFIWYGIEQPVMDRAFDVWSNHIEDYYWQLSYALNRRDINLFNSIIKKYQINFIIYDENITAIGDVRTRKAIDKQQEMLKNNEEVYQIASFGRIKVFKTKLADKTTDFMALIDVKSKIAHNEDFSLKDSGFINLGDYYNVSPLSSSKYLFPFESLFSYRFQEEKKFEINQETKRYTLSTSLPSGRYKLHLPSQTKTETILPVEIYTRLTNTDLWVKLSVVTPELNTGSQVIAKSSLEKEVRFSLGSEVSFPLFLSINNTDINKISNPSEDYRFTGSTYLTVGVNNYVRVYGQRDRVNYSLSPKKFLKAQECGGEKKDRLVFSKVISDKLVLQAKNTAICVEYGELFSNPKPSLMEVSFNYQSNTDEFPKYCFRKEFGDYSCLNKKDASKFGFSDKGLLLKEYFENDLYPRDSARFQLVLEATYPEDEGKFKQIDYSDIAISAYPILAQTQVDFEQNDDREVDIGITVADGNKELKLVIPKLVNSWSLDSIVSKNLYKKSPLNYDKLMQGDYKLKEVESGGKQSGKMKYLEAEAKDASSYILFREDELNTGIGYLVNLDTRNVSGFPFSVNIFSTREGKNHIYTYLSSNEKFDQSYFIIPPSYAFDKGLEVLLGSSSYSRSKTVNDIADLSIYPLPYDFITNIYLENQNQPNQGRFLGFTSEQAVEEVFHPNPSYYEVTLDSFTSGESLRNTPEVLLSPSNNAYLVLSQSFEKGWHAYQIQNPKSKIQNLLPFIYAKELKDHVLVNNWENGWQIGNLSLENSRLSTNSLTINDQRSTTIIIVYLPQYLEYIGFILLGAGILIVLSYPKSITTNY